MKIKSELTKLTAKMVLLSFVDYFVTPFFTSDYIYRKLHKTEVEQSAEEKRQIARRIRYLKRMGYITIFVKNKEKYVELTEKGKSKIIYLKIEDISISKPEKWDKKWRVILFDVPEKTKYERDVFRKVLQKLGFVQTQKSVYTHPFQCADEIRTITKILGISDFVTIMISEIILGEERIISALLDKGILNKDDLRN